MAVKFTILTQMREIVWHTMAKAVLPAILSPSIKFGNVRISFMFVPFINDD